MCVGTRGKPLLLDPATNKGTAFTERERRELGLGALLPPTVSSISQQLDRAYDAFSAKQTDLERYIYLAGLHDRNETLFYRLVLEHIDEMMPVIYTPVVGEACQQFSHIYRRAGGLYISYQHRGSIKRLLQDTDIREPAVIVVTDGERILGLGDQGAGGMGIPIGKLSLYTLCAGVTPYSTLPITLDVGTDNDALLKDPLYLGLRRRRVRGEAYQEFVDEFVEAVQETFPDVLLQWEDLLKENAIFQLRRFQDQLCTFNDDIQGTAAVVVAGVLAALRVTGQKLSDQRIVFAGAGAAAQGIANLLVAAMVEEGRTDRAAVARIWTTDRQGLCVKTRPGLPGFKERFARHAATDYRCEDSSRISLEEVVRTVKPTILIGVSATPGTFSEDVVRAMAAGTERPIILPLSNPTSKAECTPEQALSWSDGRALVATGSPFDPVTIGEKRHRIGQCNNAFVFPGVGLGITVSQARRVTDGMFLDAARALADTVLMTDLDEGALYPHLTRIRDCSHAVACATIRRAVAEGHADPEILEDLDRTVRAAMWCPDYVRVRYEGPPTDNVSPSAHTAAPPVGGVWDWPRPVHHA